ncbi:MAG: prepilin-type N-terminal cleavage/methylation domain-containing protein [Candidatus Hydrogenedentota bacterium]
MNPEHRRNGFSLIELLIALSILALGLLPIVLALNRLEMNTFHIGTVACSSHLAAEKLEELRSYGFSKIEADSLAYNLSASFDEGKLPGSIYSRKTFIRYQKQNANGSLSDAALADIPTDFIKIETVVCWTVEKNTRSETVVCVITRHGLKR